MYPKEFYFTVLVVVGRKEKEAIELLLPSFTPEIQNIYEQTKEGNGQKWLMIGLEDTGQLYRNVFRIIEIRKAR